MVMADKHGPPLGTDKEKTFKDIKNHDYRSACKTGFKGGFWNAHHVVPCTSLKSSLIEYLDGKEAEYRLALAFFTKWDVNAAANLLGMPTHRTYVVAFTGMEKRGIDVGKPLWFQGAKKLARQSKGSPKYPIHIPTSWGHTDYNRQVKQALDDVWTKLQVKHKNHEPIEATNLGGEIQAIGTNYRSNLVAKTNQTIEDWKAGKYDQFKMA
jgi:hypothetical protein